MKDNKSASTYSANRAVFLLLSIFLYLFYPGIVVGQTTSVGQFLHVRGKVTVKHGNRGQLAVAPGKFRFGDRLEIGQASEAIVVIARTGAHYTLAAGSVVVVEDQSLKPISGPKPQTLKAVDPILTKSTSGPPHRKVEKIFGTHPRSVDTVLLNSPQPVGFVDRGKIVLRWHGTLDAPPDGAEETHLLVRIKDMDTNKVVIEKPRPRLTWKFAVPSNLLYPGQVYTWTVLAVHNGSEEQFTAAFGLLTAQEHERIIRAEAAAKTARAQDPTDATPDLLLGQLYEQREMWAQALTAYKAAQSLDATLALASKIAEIKKKLAEN